MEDYIDNKLLPKMTKILCGELNAHKEVLKGIEWHIHEANTDRDFSNLSKKLCENIFKKHNIHKGLTIEINTPDLNLIFRLEGRTVERKIELKSTMSSNGILPGSMIMSLDPNIWTIICRRDIPNDDIEVRYGRYYLGMNVSSHEKFQDRSPRPTLNFFQFQDQTEQPNMKKTTLSSSFWKTYANSAITRILEPQNHSWQDDLVKEIIRIVLEDPDKFRDI